MKQEYDAVTAKSKADKGIRLPESCLSLPVKSAALLAPGGGRPPAPARGAAGGPPVDGGAPREGL